MLAISLHQPWATLLALGLKQFETRSWKWKHTGPFAIHAAKHWTKEQAELCRNDPFHAALVSSGSLNWSRPGYGLPLGMVIGVAWMDGCQQSRGIVDGAAELADGQKVHFPDTQFGDFIAGRWIYQITHQDMLIGMVPFRGGQRVFNVPDNLLGQRMSAMGSQQDRINRRRRDFEWYRNGPYAR